MRQPMSRLTWYKHLNLHGDVQFYFSKLNSIINCEIVRYWIFCCYTSRWYRQKMKLCSQSSTLDCHRNVSFAMSVGRVETVMACPVSWSYIITHTYKNMFSTQTGMTDRHGSKCTTDDICYAINMRHIVWKPFTLTPDALPEDTE